VHSAPAGPPPSVRVVGALVRLRCRAATVLGPLGTLVVVLRRTRLLPVTLTALTLGAFAVSAPLAPYDDDARSTAALSSTSSGEQGLVPATGDGWTQDGGPAVAAPSSDVEEEPGSPSSSSPSPSPSPSAARVRATVDDAPESTSGSPTAPSSSPSRSTSRSSHPAKNSPSSSPSPSAVSEGSESPSPTPSETPEAAAPVADPGDDVLAAVNTARAAAGCGALATDPALAAIAAEHSAALRDGGSPPELGGRTAVVATGTDPAAITAGWSGDDALLDCDLTAAGVGTSDGFWTLVAA
jgi:uncharacterized protein YkwD